MDNRIINYKSFVISTEEGEEKGIFFRNPIQRVYFGDGFYSEGYMGMYEYNEKIKNPLRKIYEILIGNYNIIKKLPEWINNESFGGFDANILCIPIYFKRQYRKLECISNDKNTNIQSIYSYGYESEFNYVGGDCYKEITNIKLKNGRILKIKRKECYKFTYSHIVQDIIDTGAINNN